MAFNQVVRARVAPHPRIAFRIHHRWLAVCAALLSLPCALPAMAARCYVDHAASGANSGATWTDAYTDLQSALIDTDCTEIWVAQGVYKPTPGSDQTISFDIKPGA
jgi:hypothetical protein